MSFELVTIWSESSPEDGDSRNPTHQHLHFVEGELSHMLTLLYRIVTPSFLYFYDTARKQGSRTIVVRWGHIKNIHLHSCKHKTVTLKLALTLTLTLTDTGGTVLTLMLGYRRLRIYKLKRKIQN